MKWVVRVVRSLLGLGFVVIGSDYFLKFIPEPDMSQLPQVVKDYMGVLMPTKYLAVVKTLEVVGGLLLLSGRFTPLGVVILMPIAVNILLFDLLLARQPGLGAVIVVLLVVVMFGYRRHFVPFFVPATT